MCYFLFYGLEKFIDDAAQVIFIMKNSILFLSEYFCILIHTKRISDIFSTFSEVFVALCFQPEPSNCTPEFFSPVCSQPASFRLRDTDITCFSCPIRDYMLIEEKHLSGCGVVIFSSNWILSIAFAQRKISIPIV